MYENYMNYPQGGFMPRNYMNSNISQPHPIFSFVNGVEGAKAFIVPPNTFAMLMDSDAQQFFIKVSDANGICNIVPYDFQEKKMPVEQPIAAVQPPIDTKQFVTKEELAEIIKQLQIQPIAETKKERTLI